MSAKKGIIVIMTERTYSSPVPQTGRRWPKLWLRAKAQRRTVQFLTPWCKQNREIKGNKFPDKDGSYSIVLIAKCRLQRRETRVSNQIGKSLTGDWSLDDRRRKALRRRSAASLPARLLGAIKNCKSSRSTLKQRRKKERKRQKFL